MRRRSQESRREDAEVTRSRLVEAGVRIFARNTYETASVREIAAEAGVTVAMVGYHFSGKEGLYRAVIDRIRRAGLELLGPATMAAQRTMKQYPENRDALVFSAISLLRDLLQTTREDATFDWAKIMLREQLDASTAGAVLQDRLYSPYMSTLASLIALIDGRTEAGRTDMIRAFALMGQMIVFRSTRDAVHHLLGEHILPDDDVAILMEQIERQLVTGSMSARAVTG